MTTQKKNRNNGLFYLAIVCKCVRIGLQISVDLLCWFFIFLRRTTGIYDKIYSKVYPNTCTLHMQIQIHN